MSYDLDNLEKKFKETQEWLTKEFSQIRTGRATPALLDSVRVDSYGTKIPINQTASIITEGPKSIRVTPWDTSQINAIEQAINDADLGVSVISDNKGVRVSIPELTEETRGKILKLAKVKHEEARIAIRRERDEVWSDIQKEKSEDDKYRAKEEMEKITKEANDKLDELFEKKEKEILN